MSQLPADADDRTRTIAAAIDDAILLSAEAAITRPSEIRHVDVRLWLERRDAADVGPDEDRLLHVHVERAWCAREIRA